MTEEHIPRYNAQARILLNTVTVLCGNIYLLSKYLTREYIYTTCRGPVIYNRTNIGQ